MRAVDLNMSHAAVQRILAQAKLQPHRLDRYMASDDPRFEQKAADILGLYMNPPQHAAVFCVDEKTAIQALDRLPPRARSSQKAPYILGVYMNPPQHAAVFCVDEKTAIQALDRLDPVLPLSPGRAE